jgi:hypothetical protein
MKGMMNIWRDLGVDGKIILKRILKEYVWFVWTESFGSHRTGASGGLL